VVGGHPGRDLNELLDLVRVPHSRKLHGAEDIRATLVRCPGNWLIASDPDPAADGTRRQPCPAGDLPDALTGRRELADLSDGKTLVVPVSLQHAGKSLYR